MSPFVILALLSNQYICILFLFLCIDRIAIDWWRNGTSSWSFFFSLSLSHSFYFMFKVKRKNARAHSHKGLVDRNENRTVLLSVSFLIELHFKQKKLSSQIRWQWRTNTLENMKQILMSMRMEIINRDISSSK